MNDTYKTFKKWWRKWWSELPSPPPAPVDNDWRWIFRGGGCQ